MMDIIVTTPKSEMANAAREAADAKRAGGGTFYFRRFPVKRWPNMSRGDRVYYVEDGYVRGFSVVDECSLQAQGFTCDTTGRRYGPGYYVFMRADSWRWIKPIPMKGFQGYRYAASSLTLISGIPMSESFHPIPNPPRYVEIVGGWLDPRPV